MDIKTLNQQFDSFQSVTDSARRLSAQDQDFDDGKQWDSEDAEKLEDRNQPPVVYNHIKPKVNVLTGIQESTRGQPKLLPRTPENESAADAWTEGLRYVSDNTDLKTKSSKVFRDTVIAGYGAAIIETDKQGGETTIVVREIPWNRYYFDPNSKKLDFSDKSFDGIAVWMERQDAIIKFPGKEKEINDLVVNFGTDDIIDDMDGFDANTSWVDKKNERVRICEHYFRDEGRWKLAFIADNLFLTEPVDSPFEDEFGEPVNPIEAQTAYIDRIGNRYGEVRAYIWPQKEINWRRSRLVYASSVNRTIGQDGAVDDVNEMKSELAKADGHVKTNIGFEFDVIPNDDITETAITLYRDAMDQIDRLGANPSLAGRGNTRSGRQDQVQQQAGQVELASLFGGHKSWEIRVYRQILNRMKQFWTAEKWVRITDDPTDLQWVGINMPVTMGQVLQEQAEQGSEEAAAMLQENLNNPQLNEVVETRNKLSELDVDIKIVESQDLPTLRHETADSLMKLGVSYGPEKVPMELILEYLDIPDKDKIKKSLAPDSQQIQLQQMAQQLELASKQADIDSKNAKTQLMTVEAQTKDIENQLTLDKYPNIVADRNADSEAKQIDNQQKSLETTKLALQPVDSVNIHT